MAPLTSQQAKDTKAKVTTQFDEWFCSVVRITAGSHEKGGWRVIAQGSGFVWNKDRRLLVTCCHVIGEAPEIRATINDGTGTTYEAKVVFSDGKRDVAVLSVDKAPKDKLKPITAGNSENVRLGEDVYVIGHPFGLNTSLSKGVISAIHRENQFYGDVFQIKGVIQTDAAINPGNSGGPLLDSSGKVIGMIVCIMSSSVRTHTGVGFVIPVNVISEIVERYKEGKGANVRIDRQLHSSSQYPPMNRPNFVNGVAMAKSGPKKEKIQERLGHCGHFHNDIIRYISRENSEFVGYMILEELKLHGRAKMHNGDLLVCDSFCEKCGKVVVDILPRDHVEKVGLDCIPVTSVVSDEWEEMKSAIFNQSESGLRRDISSAPAEKTVSAIVDQLEKFGKVTRPVLGIKLAPDQSVEQSGVLVLDASAGKTPTKRDAYGRLASGDIITSVHGKKVTNVSDLHRILDQCKVGDKVIVEVTRGDQKEKISVIREVKPDES